MLARVKRKLRFKQVRCRIRQGGRGLFDSNSSNGRRLQGLNPHPEYLLTDAEDLVHMEWLGEDS